MLIDASQAFEKLRKNQGSRNCTITPAYQDAILKTYMDFIEKEADVDKVASKIFDGDDFRYYSVTIERPLRLRSQFNALKIDELLYDKTNLDSSKWLYQTYGKRVFEGIDDEILSIKEYFNDNDIKMTDKKLNKLISVKEWKARLDLMNASKQLIKVIGTDVYWDYNLFAEKVNGKNGCGGISASCLRQYCRRGVAALYGKPHPRYLKKNGPLLGIGD